MKVLVTGASGFVGSKVVDKQLTERKQVVRQSRQKLVNKHGTIDYQLDLNEIDNFINCINDASIIIHTAAVTGSRSLTTVELDLLKKINVKTTLELAKQAAQNGVKRFVFISSIKVNGEVTERSQSFNENTGSYPIDAYGVSKYEAEQGLLEIAKNFDMEVVIIRPPLVYGPGVKANFASLISLVKKGIPLPLGAVNNRRSMIALDNLVDFISLCADRERSPKAANQVFVISDDEDVSTTELLRKIAKAYDIKQWLIPIPVGLMKFVAKLLGKSEQADRVFGNLQIDCSKAKTLLGWKPVVTMDEQLKKMAEAER
jgi:nucleoside-diphosphate-sugar epimerase